MSLLHTPILALPWSILQPYPRWKSPAVIKNNGVLVVIQTTREKVVWRPRSKNWSVKNNSCSVIFSTSQECEEGQHSGCYTNTSSWGVAILTLWKCYLHLTIRSVALTLPKGCLDTLLSVVLTLPEVFFDTLVTPSTGRTDTYSAWARQDFHYQSRDKASPCFSASLLSPYNIFMW